jgi:hypothetical protein
MYVTRPSHGVSLKEAEHNRTIRYAKRLLEAAGYAISEQAESPDIVEAKRLLEDAGYVVGKIPDDEWED